jgi:hypothetical protein
VRTLTLVLMAALAVRLSARADVIDRILAVVDGAVITQSDLSSVIRLGLVSAGRGTDPAGAALDQLIERRLILAEVDRYAPPDPPAADVERAFDAVRTRVGPAAMETTLLQTGGSVDQLRLYLRDDLRIEAYLRERFGAIQPSEEDVAEYFRALGEDFGGRPLPEVRDAVVSALTTDRRSSVVREWVAGLRRRANITILTADSTTTPDGPGR